jgi:hypothetical protein
MFENIFDNEDIKYMKPFVKQFNNNESKLDYNDFKKKIKEKMKKYLSKNTGEVLTVCRCQLLGKETISIYNSEDPKFHYIINTTTGEVKHYSSEYFENNTMSWSPEVDFNTIVDILDIQNAVRK